MSVSKVTQLFSFEDKFIENIVLRPNGHLILTSLAANTPFGFDPWAEQPVPQAWPGLPGADSLTGIAQIGPDTYAVSGGVKQGGFRFSKGSMHVYTISFENDVDKPEIKTVAHVPETELMNGMCALPEAEGIILSADSRMGCIWRVDTRTGAVDVAFQDDVLAMGSLENRVPCGVNGIKIDGGYLYFTNSAKRLFGRVPISKDGDRTGDVEVFPTIAETADMMTADDDFVIDASGAAWVARHPDSLVRITQDQRQEVLIDKDSHDVKLLDPTATLLDAKRNVLYIVTGGNRMRGGAVGGQVIKVELSGHRAIRS